MYIKHSRRCLTKLPNTLKFVKDTLLGVVFLTIGNVDRRSLSCLINYLKCQNPLKSVTKSYFRVSFCLGVTFGVAFGFSASLSPGVSVLLFVTLACETN